MKLIKVLSLYLRSVKNRLPLRIHTVLSKIKEQSEFPLFVYLQISKLFT